MNKISSTKAGLAAGGGVLIGSILREFNWVLHLNLTHLQVICLIFLSCLLLALLLNLKGTFYLLNCAYKRIFKVTED